MPVRCHFKARHRSRLLASPSYSWHRAHCLLLLPPVGSLLLRGTGSGTGFRGTTVLCSFSVMPYSLLCLVGFAFLWKRPRESSPIGIAPIFLLSLQCGEDSQCKVGKAGGGKSWRTYVTFHTAVMPSGKCLLTPHLPCALRETKRHDLGCSKKVPVERIALLAFLGAQLSHQGWARQMFMIPSEGWVWLCSGRMLYPRG